MYRKDLNWYIILTIQLRGGKTYMRKKIVGIIICTLLIAAIFLPNVGSMEAANQLNQNPRLETFQEKCVWSGEGDNLDNWAITPSIDLSDVTSVHLEITTLFEILPLDSPDYGYIKISDNGGSDWTILETIQGYTPEWKTIRIDLQNWTDKNVLIAFEFTTEPDSGGSSISDGWWIREIVVFESHETIYFEDFSEYNINDPWNDWTIVLHMGLVNAPPSAPSISGETNGKVGKNYNYTFTSTEPDLENVFYYIKWGDGTADVEWDGPHITGSPITMEHTYSSQGTYTIEAKAKDPQQEESKWSSLKVTIKKNKNKQSANSLFLQLLERLLKPIFSLLSILNWDIEFPVNS